MIEYMIVAESYEVTGSFAEKINALIAKGWKPQGGVSSLRDGVNWHFSQAMTREIRKTNR